MVLSERFELFGRDYLRHLTQIIYIAFIGAIVIMSVFYPFPLTLKDVPKDSSKSFHGVVVLRHSGGIAIGQIFSGGAGEEFRLKDSQLYGEVLGAVRRYDLSRSKAFTLSYKLSWAALVLFYYLSQWARRRFPEAPKSYNKYEDTLSEYKRNFANQKDALKGRFHYNPRWAGTDGGDRFYLHFYWNEVAIGLVIAVSVAAALGINGYLNPSHGKKDYQIKKIAPIKAPKVEGFLGDGSILN